MVLGSSQLGERHFTETVFPSGEFNECVWRDPNSASLKFSGYSDEEGNSNFGEQLQEISRMEVQMHSAAVYSGVLG
jgi:hypothetical protein